MNDMTTKINEILSAKDESGENAYLWLESAAGALTGNDKLRQEGKSDQAVGKVKQAVQKAADTVNKAVKKCESEVPAIRERLSVCLWSIETLFPAK